MFKSLKEKILSIIYPPKCMFCSDIIPSHEVICKKCWYSVKSETSFRILAEFANGTVGCVSPFKYKGDVREAICRFKFYGQKSYSEFFADMIYGELLTSGLELDFDIISAVPLSKKRLKSRGYNQSEFLAITLAKKFSVPYQETLVKIKENFPQHNLPRSERIVNVKGVYAAKSAKLVRDKNILLCDDIITTGNTLRECIKILKLNGAANIVCCTIAYV